MYTLYISTIEIISLVIIPVDHQLTTEKQYIQCGPIKRKPERAVVSTDIESFIKYNFHLCKVQFIFFHLTSKLICNAHAWPSKTNVNFQCQNQVAQNLWLRTVRTTYGPRCSNGLAKGWFISISISFCSYAMHVCPNLSMRMAACFKRKKERNKKERKNERGTKEERRKKGKQMRKGKRWISRGL